MKVRPTHRVSPRNAEPTVPIPMGESFGLDVVVAAFAIRAGPRLRRIHAAPLSQMTQVGQAPHRSDARVAIRNGLETPLLALDELHRGHRPIVDTMDLAQKIHERLVPDCGGAPATTKRTGNVPNSDDARERSHRAVRYVVN